MQSNYPDSDFLIDIAHDAGEIMLSHFGHTRNYVLKADMTPLTQADKLINKMVLQRFERDYPHINMLAEEGNREVEDAEYTALCDPIDGTSAFVMGIPVSTFCLAIMKGGTPIAAVIYDPYQARMWLAHKGQGATLNNKYIHVSEISEMKDRPAVDIATAPGGTPESLTRKMFLIAHELQEQGFMVNTLKSVSYSNAMMATGQSVGVIFPWGSAWDIMPGDLLVREAGGKVTDLRGKQLSYRNGPINGMISSNGHFHETLVEVVAKYS